MRGTPPEIGGRDDGAVEFPVFERTRPWRDFGAKLIPELSGREINTFRSIWATRTGKPLRGPIILSQLFVGERGY
jgi:hypothetical protein